MKIRIVSRDSEVKNELEQHATGRTRQTFARFTHWVRGVRVRLADLNGPRRGRDDKSVAIELGLASGGPLRFEARADTYERAIELVLDRAKRSLLDSPHLGGRRPGSSVGWRRRRRPESPERSRYI